ncbi:hypothetical protein ACFWUZ_07410 [Streptomyces sp. NPDC058646]|uniref:hypothetical protein n=1 Tax=Streptomyces sp. NPDC058646 TaxID=3346574 RepID=UPI00364F8CFD
MERTRRTVTLLLLVGSHPLVVWGSGEAIALLVLLSQVLLRAPARTAAVLGPLLGLGCMAVSKPARPASPRSPPTAPPRSSAASRPRATRPSARCAAS